MSGLVTIFRPFTFLNTEYMICAKGGHMQTLIKTAVLHPIQAVLARLAFAIAFGLGGRDTAADFLNHIRGKD